MRSVFLGNSGKKNQQNGIIGLDLCEQYAQVSIWQSGADRPETVACVRMRELGEYEDAPQQPNQRTDRLAWLARKCLLHPKAASFLPHASLLVVALWEIDRETAVFLERLAGELNLPREKVVGISREESFFYYSVQQPEELWKNSCMICDLTEKHLRTLLLEANREAAPVVTQTQSREFPEMVDFHEPGEPLTEGQKRKMDQEFLDILGEFESGRPIETIYLIGEAFEDDWYEASLKWLCRGRRVFYGDNLYSKGACYSGMARLENAEGSKYRYFAKDRLNVDVGLNGFVGGKSVCQPLLDGKTSWYEAEAECEFYLNRDLSFSLQVAVSEDVPARGAASRSNISGKYNASGKCIGEKEVVVTLDGVPDRPDKATRIHLKVFCPRAGVVHLSMEDLGFGEIYPATHKLWEEEFSLGGITN